VVEGLDPIVLKENIKSASTPYELTHLLDSAIDQARLVLYLRETGAEKYTIFLGKPHAFCEDHWLEHARELGIQDAFDGGKCRS